VFGGRNTDTDVGSKKYSSRGSIMALRGRKPEATSGGTGVPAAVIPAYAGIQTGPRIGVRGDG
jgi:hypothetical protein